VKYFLIIFFTLTLLILSQERIPVHERDKLEFGSSENLHELPEYSRQEIIPLLKSNSTLSKTIFGFLPYWEYPTAKSYLRYELLTHIAIFDFSADSLGNISYPLRWPWIDVINAAHSNNVKVIMCITCFDKYKIRSIISNSKNKSNFFENVLTIVKDFNLDGVNIDFENLYSSDEGNPINNFMNDLTEFIHSYQNDLEISIDVPPINWSSHWKLSELMNYCDYVFIMGYDFYGDWSETTGPSSPLTGDTYNLSYSLLNSKIGFGEIVNSAPGKLILGIPYYGNEWIAKSGNAGDSVITFLGSNRYRDNFSNSFYYGKLWNSTYQVPWFRWQENGIWHQVWYDDDESIGLKYDLAISKNLKGIGMWALGYDGSRQELWNVIKQKFSEVVSVEIQSLPNGFILCQNYPNPFNSTTKIRYSIPPVRTSLMKFLQIKVQLKIYDILGNEVATLINYEQPQGIYEVEFDASEYNLCSGIYFYHLEILSDLMKITGYFETRKMILLK
jgi:spore germination protein YaaH